MHAISFSHFRRTALAILAVAATATAHADSLRITTSAYSNGSNGGSYTVTILNGPANTSSYSPLAMLAPGTFEAFCLEPTEHFTPGSTYNYTISSDAIGGGAEHSSRNIGLGDRLSVGTAWLYSQFASGTLASFDYSAAGRKNSNLLLQQAFWFLEDDRSTGSLFSNAAVSHFGSVNAAKANATAGFLGVYALNLTSGSNNQNNHQSQLYYNIPDGGSSLVLLGLAFLGCAAFRKRFSV